MNKKYWSISQSDIKTVKKIVTKNKNHSEFIIRKKKNVERVNINLSKEEVWNTIIRCLLSSQQKSGKGSRIRDFIDSKPFPFSYQFCLDNKKEIDKIVSKRLSKEGMRFGETIGKHLLENLKNLEGDNWKIILEDLKLLLRNKITDKALGAFQIFAFVKILI